MQYKCSSCLSTKNTNSYDISILKNNSNIENNKYKKQSIILCKKCKIKLEKNIQLNIKNNYIYSRICSKTNCYNPVPKYFIDENGKQHNCLNRKFCFDCSPYKKDNTQKKENIKNENKYSYFKLRQEKTLKIIKDIVGDKCWICGYVELPRPEGRGFSGRIN